MNYIYQFGQYEGPENEFDEFGVHSETGTIFDPQGFDVEGFDEFDFNREGVNRHTRTLYNRLGFDRVGKSEDHVDVLGFTDAGVHSVTGTEYDSEGYTVDGYDSEGIDRNGYDRNGFDFFTGIHKKYPPRPADITDYLNWVQL